MVTLPSEAAVDEVMKAARLLRDVDDSTVRNGVFINRDLTKEEAKAAFLKRQARRSKSTTNRATLASGSSSGSSSTDKSQHKSQSDVTPFSLPKPAATRIEHTGGCPSDMDGVDSVCDQHTFNPSQVMTGSPAGRPAQ